jgi:hypothetical protein
MHKSFRDFIINQSRCPDVRFFVSAPDHHGQLALACLDSLKRGLTKEDLCCIGDASKFNTDVGNLASLVSKSLPLDVQYACRHWAAHLHNASTEDSTGTLEQLVTALTEFVDNCLLRWMEALSPFDDWMQRVLTGN